MLLTLDDIADIKKEITNIESSMAIAADCIDRGMQALSQLQEVVLKGDISPFYISATNTPDDSVKEAFGYAMEALRNQHKADK